MKTHYKSNQAVIRNGEMTYLPRCRKAKSLPCAVTIYPEAVTCKNCINALAGTPIAQFFKPRQSK